MAEIDGAPGSRDEQAVVCDFGSGALARRRRQALARRLLALRIDHANDNQARAPEPGPWAAKGR